MAEQKIDGFYSEYDIRTDKATTSLEKLSKEEQALQKALKGGRKETQARTKATTDRGKAEEKERKAAEKRRKDEQKEEVNRAKAFEKERKTKESAAKTAARKAGDTVSGAASIAGAAAGGSAIGAVASVLPLGLGALIVGAVAAINRAASAIETVASQSKERARAGRAGLGIDIQGKGFGEGFSAADIRGAKTALGEAGVEKLTQREIDTLSREGKRVGSLSEAVGNILGGKGVRTLGQEGKNLESIMSAIPDTPQTAAFKAQTGFELFAALQARQNKRVEAQTKESRFTLGINRRADALADREYNRAAKLAGVAGIDEAINATRDAEDLFVRGAAIGASKTVKGLKKLTRKAQALGGGKFSDVGKSIALDKAEEMGLIDEKRREEIEAKEGILQTGDTDESSGPIPASALQSRPSGGAPNVTFNISGVNDPMAVYNIIREKFSTLMNQYAGGEMAAELGLRGGSF